METSSTRVALHTAQQIHSPVNPWLRMSPKVRIGPVVSFGFRARGIGSNEWTWLPLERNVRLFEHEQLFVDEAPRFDVLQIAFPAQFLNC
jgi:hypothetical protein